MHRLHTTALSRPDPIRVLVVDDEPSMCDYVSQILRGSGYRVTTAISGNQAIALVQLDGPPDLLLTDLKMPQMEGDELAGRLRQSTPDLKVLYLTGFSQALFATRAVLWEGEAFLEKPCSPQALLEGVSQLLFNHVAPSVPGLPRQESVIRSLFVGLARNPRRDVV